MRPRRVPSPQGTRASRCPQTVCGTQQNTTAESTVGSVKPVIDALLRCDGLATTAQLRALGIHRGQLDIAYMYGRIWRVRKGMWCLPGLPRPVLRAQRVKGRLACVSALAFHGVIEDDGGPLHVSARVGQVSWHPAVRSVPGGGERRCAATGNR